MVEISKIESGIARYLDAELVNKLPENGWRKFGVGVAAGLVAKRGGVALSQIKEHPAVKAFGLVDQAGCVDVEILRELAKERIPDTGLQANIPLIGKITIYKADVEKLYGYIAG